MEGVEVKHSSYGKMSHAFLAVDWIFTVVTARLYRPKAHYYTID